MTQKKLEKKVILTANLKGLSEAKFQQKTRSMARAELDEPSFVPNLTPSASDVIQIIDDLETLYEVRGTLQREMKVNTTRIRKKEEEIRNIITDQWMPQAQTAIGRDIVKAKRLGFGIKGQDKHGQSEASVNNSIPFIIRIESASLRHTLHIINNHHSGIILPEDADRIDVYEWVGDEEPPYDLKKLSYLGVAKSGKFVNHFEPEQREKHVWYIVVYVNKKTGKPCEHGDPMKAMII
ncbi:MAG: hypothetical protein WCL06_13330 [Bacteroidota bacterium]